MNMKAWKKQLCKACIKDPPDLANNILCSPCKYLPKEMFPNVYETLKE